MWSGEYDKDDLQSEDETIAVQMNYDLGYENSFEDGNGLSENENSLEDNYSFGSFSNKNSNSDNDIF